MLLVYKRTCSLQCMRHHVSAALCIAFRALEKRDGSMAYKSNRKNNIKPKSRKANVCSMYDFMFFAVSESV